MRDNRDRNIKIRTTSALHSEIKMREEGKGDHNQIKQNNEVDRHREKHHEGLRVSCRKIKIK